jgi:iron complex outermembrane receptor protein
MRFTFILSFILLHQLHALAQCTYSISGVIRDEDQQILLEKATVSIVELNKSVMTSASGRYNFNGLCQGDYTIKVTHADCQTIEMHIHLKDDMQQDFVLSHTENRLKEVVVVGTSVVRPEGMTGELKGRQLLSTRGASLGESLQKIAGVTVLQTGNNIYKPVIQGLHSSRVLILNNGIRQEGQQWGSEHAPEIDPYVANRLTVIKGAASVRYGGDAIGGVVLVEPRLLQYRKDLSGEVNVAAFSNNRQGVISALIESAFDKKEKTAWRLQGTFKRGGNARTPSYWLKNSALEEANMSASFGWRDKTKGLEVFYSLFHTRIGIFSGSHIGNLTDLQNVIALQEPPVYIKNADFSYEIDRPFQAVQHQLLKIKTYKEYDDKYRINLILSCQYNQRREFDNIRSESVLPQLELNLLTNMADFILEHFKHPLFKGSMGANIMHQANSINYRYFVPNYQSFDVGVWAAEKYQKNKWQLEAGLRYDIRNRFGISDNDKEPFDLLTGNALLPGAPYGTTLFQGISGTGLVAYKLDDAVRISFTLSSAWRAPQINELFSNGLHHGAARIEKGFMGLKAERAYSAMGTLIVKKEKWEIDWGVYNKWINDFIYLQPGFPPLLTIRGAFPVFDYTQTNANLSGTDWSMIYRINNHLTAGAKASLLRAFDLKAKTWLIQMPSDRYESDVEYSFADGKRTKQPFVKIIFQHVTRQQRVPPTGNIKVKDVLGNVTMKSDYIDPPAAYSLVNFEAGTGLESKTHKIDIVFNVFNALNVSYRDYMNAFRYFSLDRGRNISLKIKYSL